MNNDQNDIPDEAPTPVEVPVPNVEVQFPVDEINDNVPTENLDYTAPHNDSTEQEPINVTVNIDVNEQPEPDYDVNNNPTAYEENNNDDFFGVSNGLGNEEFSNNDNGNGNGNSIQPEVNSSIYDNPNENIYSANPIYEAPQTNSSTNNEQKRFKSQAQSDTKATKQKARFVKILSDDTYDYYLDRKAVRWINMPYSTSEYMADVWITMLEKSTNSYNDLPRDMYEYVSAPDDDMSEAASKGIIYDEVDVKVLRTKKYFLEHYYLRPKTRQIQFLCELEVIGRPQNAISERAYEYRNWENLIPGSVESSIYYGVLSDIGTGKASKRGHMTFIDMLDEYARIVLN